MTDREAMAELTVTFSRLTVEIAKTITKLFKALSDNNTLTHQLSSNTSTSRAITPYVHHDPNTPKPQYVHYCFTDRIKSSLTEYTHVYP